jgi:hypothetical protein
MIDLKEFKMSKCIIYSYSVCLYTYIYIYGFEFFIYIGLYIYVCIKILLDMIYYFSTYINIFFRIVLTTK